METKMFKVIVESTKDSIVVFDKEKIIYANTSAATLVGLDSPEQLIGENPVNYIQDKDQEWISEEIAEQFVERDDKYHFQTKINRVDGTTRDVAINASMIDWEDSLAILTVIRDITDIVKATKELEKSEEDKRRILDLLPDEISFKDTDYRFIWVNRSLAKALGKTREEIIGKTCYELAYDYAEPCEHCKIEELKRDKKIIRDTVNIVSGLIRDTYYVPVISDDEVVGVIEISRDITELDKAQRETQEAMFKLRSLYQHTLSLDEAETEEEAYEITYKALKNSLAGIFFDLFLRKEDTMIESFVENPMIVSLDGAGVIARTFREGKPQLLNDTSLDPDYIAVAREPMRSELAVPIKIGNDVIGIINVEDENIDRFNDQDQWLLEIFASNIVNTIIRIRTVEKLKRTNKTSQAIIQGLRKILSNETFERTARDIFDILRDLIEAKAGYVALLNKEGTENEVLFLESGGDSCTVDPDLPMPIRGLREHSYSSGRAVYENDFYNSEWWDFLPEGHVHMKNVLFTPLNIEGKTVGVIGLANKKTGFTKEDVEIAESFGELAALALTHSRYLEQIQQNERELEASEQRYRNLFENLLGGYAYHRIILDEEGKPVDYVFLEVNHGFETLTGLKRENIIGRRVTEVLPGIEKDPTNWIERYGEVAVEGTQIQFESFSESIEKWFVVNAYSNEKGYFATLFYDLTERKEEERERLRLERELVEERLASEKTREISEIKNNFMSTATHEIRTPITSIKGYVELLREGFMTEDEALQNQALTVLTRNINRLEKLADDLLDAQRIEANKLEITKTLVNIPQFVKGIENEIAPILVEKHQKLTVDMDIEEEKLSFDELRISQVLINLLNNASYYSGAMKPIHLVIKETHDNVVFRVVDKGIGLSREDMKELFKPFPNIPMRTIKRGTGLGLNISKSIVELHKGRIWAESDGVGLGSTFSFSLPK